MSHGGGGGGGGSPGGHMGHHGGHHHGGQGHHGGRNTISLFSLLSNLSFAYTAAWEFIKWIPGLKPPQKRFPKQVSLEGSESLSESERKELTEEIESMIKPPSFKDKVMHFDLRPIIFLVLFIFAVKYYLHTVYWLRHNDDPTGITFSNLNMRKDLQMNGSFRETNGLGPVDNTASNNEILPGTLVPGNYDPSIVPQASNSSQLPSSAFGVPRTMTNGQQGNGQ